MQRVRVVGIVLATLAVATSPGCSDEEPRSFDADLLAPLIQGTVLLESPIELCPQGNAPPNGGCSAVAVVAGRQDKTVEQVVASNAVAAGFVQTEGAGVYSAKRGDQCLDVTQPSGDTADDGAATVILGWC
jgi:hypothetical protein